MTSQIIDSNKQNTNKKEVNGILEISSLDKGNIRPNVLVVEEGMVRALVGEKSTELNENSIFSLAQSYADFLTKNKMNNILVSHDGSMFGRLFSKVFASTLIDSKIKSYFTQDNKSSNNAISVWMANNSEIDFNGIVTFSHSFNKKEYTINFFNKDGSRISPFASNNITSKNINTGYISVNIPNVEVPCLKNININEYIEEISTNDDFNDVNLLVSNYFDFDKEILNKFFVRNNIKNKVIDFNQNEINKKKDNETTIARKSILKSWNYKCDAIVNFINNNNGFEFIIKYKKRRKFLTLNDLAVIYLYYVKKYEKEPLSDKSILLNYTASDFIKYYAKTNNLKIKRQESMFLNLSNIENRDILLATDGEHEFISLSNIYLCTDPLINIRLFLKLVSFFKKQNKTLHDVLIDIYNEDKFYRYSKKTETMIAESAKLFFYRLQNQTKIDEKQILRVEKKQFFHSKIYKIYFENNSHIIFEYIPQQEKLNTFFSLWEEKKPKEESKKTFIKSKKIKPTYDQEFIDLIIQEKKCLDFLKDLKAQFKIGKFSWKGFFKYTIFAIILILLFWFIFEFILDNSNNSNLFHQIHYMLKEQEIYGYMIPVFIASSTIVIFINTMLVKRVLMILNENVKLRHLITAQIISISISTITPMIYGGESVGYWYLRRKGAKSAPIAAAFLVQSFFTQINIVLFSAVLSPIAFVDYLLPIWDPNDPQSISVVILAFVGFFIDIFSAIMISLLTFSWWAQRSIAKNLNKFIEWFPFVIERDASLSGAKLQYEFSNINQATKKIISTGVWYRDAAIFLELLAYRCLGRIIDMGVISSLVANMFVNNNVQGYFEAIIASSLVRNINAVNFITPGGLGISDWAMKNVQEILFVDKGNTATISAYKNINVHIAMVRFIFTLSWMGISLLLLFTIWIGESRIERYKRIKSTFIEEEIIKNNIKVKTSFYKQSVVYWILGIISAIIIWNLVYTYLFL